MNSYPAGTACKESKACGMSHSFPRSEMTAGLTARIASKYSTLLNLRLAKRSNVVCKAQEASDCPLKVALETYHFLVSLSSSRRLNRHVILSSNSSQLLSLITSTSHPVEFGMDLHRCGDDNGKTSLRAIADPLIAYKRRFRECHFPMPTRGFLLRYPVEPIQY